MHDDAVAHASQCTDPLHHKLRLSVKEVSKAGKLSKTACDTVSCLVVVIFTVKNSTGFNLLLGITVIMPHPLV